MQTGAKGVGCYKCGKPGHWSRDCKVPPSEWINRNHAPTQNASQANQNNTEGAAPDVQPLGLPAKKKRAVKPKLTFETLQRPQDGLPVVFLTFANRFRKKFKGRGHEGSDLRRLLEMYERWQHNLFPSLKFDDFVAGVEKIGRTAEVKKELRELRMGAIRLLEEEDQPEPAPLPDQHQSNESREAVVNPAQSAEEAFGANGPAEDDEDYMLDAEFQEEVAHNADAEGVMDDDLMDELMDDLGDAPVPARRPEATGNDHRQTGASTQDRSANADLDEDAEHVPRRATSNQSSGDNERQSFYCPEAADKTADKAGSVSPNIEEQEDSASEKQVVPPKRQRIDSDSDSDSDSE